MRPTLSEQLRGLRHILDHVVAPEVQGAYATDILLGVSRALEMLALRAGEVGPFLVWDNNETRELLRMIATSGAAVTEPIDPIEPIATGDVDALDAENERLRGILAAVIPAIAADASTSELHGAVVVHLRERVARYPFASTATLPQTRDGYRVPLR
ncbi:MAG: hypothetical protein ABIQ73_29600 [Acidimicrobiales bacterium]